MCKETGIPELTVAGGNLDESTYSIANLHKIIAFKLLKAIVVHEYMQTTLHFHWIKSKSNLSDNGIKINTLDAKSI